MRKLAGSMNGGNKHKKLKQDYNISEEISNQQIPNLKGNGPFRNLQDNTILAKDVKGGLLRLVHKNWEKRNGREGKENVLIRILQENDQIPILSPTLREVHELFGIVENNMFLEKDVSTDKSKIAFVEKLQEPNYLEEGERMDDLEGSPNLNISDHELL